MMPKEQLKAIRQHLYEDEECEWASSARLSRSCTDRYELLDEVDRLTAENERLRYVVVCARETMEQKP